MGLTVAVARDPLDGGFVAEVREVPGCLSQGETAAEALRNVADALEEVARLGVGDGDGGTETGGGERGTPAGHGDSEGGEKSNGPAAAAPRLPLDAGLRGTDIVTACDWDTGGPLGKCGLPMRAHVEAARFNVGHKFVAPPAPSPVGDGEGGRCAGTLGKKPWWMSEDQYDASGGPCRCLLPAGHEGRHTCEHLTEPPAPSSAPAQGGESRG